MDSRNTFVDESIQRPWATIEDLCMMGLATGLLLDSTRDNKKHPTAQYHGVALRSACLAALALLISSTLNSCASSKMASCDFGAATACRGLVGHLHRSQWIGTDRFHLTHTLVSGQLLMQLQLVKAFAIMFSTGYRTSRFASLVKPMEARTAAHMKLGRPVMTD